MPGRPLFFFGAMSPYSWFAAERIDQLLPQAQWRGVFAGALFKSNGRVSWGLTEHREAGIADCEARAAMHGLGPIRWPVPWPTSDLMIARAMTYAGSPRAGAPGGLRQFALAAMRLAFLEGADLGELDAVLEAGGRCGIETQALRDAIADPAIKDALRKTNDAALALGVFGVPTVAVGEQLFWGDDRLPDAVVAYASSAGP